jgi:hypothetical protein
MRRNLILAYILNIANAFLINTKINTKLNSPKSHIIGCPAIKTHNNTKLAESEL